MWCGILWAGRRSTWVVSGFLLRFPYPLPYCAGSSIVCVYRGSLVVSRMASWVSCQYSDLSSIFPLFSTTEIYTRCCKRTCRHKPSLLNSIYITLESCQLLLHVAVTGNSSQLAFKAERNVYYECQPHKWDLLVLEMPTIIICHVFHLIAPWHLIQCSLIAPLHKGYFPLELQIWDCLLLSFKIIPLSSWSGWFADNNLNSLVETTSTWKNHAWHVQVGWWRVLMVILEAGREWFMSDEKEAHSSSYKKLKYESWWGRHGVSAAINSQVSWHAWACHITQELIASLRSFWKGDIGYKDGYPCGPMHREMGYMIQCKYIYSLVALVVAL